MMWFKNEDKKEKEIKKLKQENNELKINLQAIIDENIDLLQELEKYRHINLSIEQCYNILSNLKKELPIKIGEEYAQI